MNDLRRSYVIEEVKDTEQWGHKLWRLTSSKSGSICIDAFGRRPEPGDTMVLHYADASLNSVIRTVVIQKAIT